MRGLIYTFVIRICHKTHFRMAWPIYRVRTTKVLARLRIQARLGFSTLCTWAGKTPCHEKICLRWFQSVKTQNLTSATVYSSCVRNILSRSRTAKTPFRQRVGWSAFLLSIYRLCHDAAQMKIRWYICDTKKKKFLNFSGRSWKYTNAFHTDQFASIQCVISFSQPSRFQ